MFKGISVALCRSCDDKLFEVVDADGLCEDCAHKKFWAAHWRGKVAEAQTAHAAAQPERRIERR